MDNLSDRDLGKELNYLKGNRKFLRSKVTRLCNTVASNIENFDNCSCMDLISDLNALQIKLTKINDQISKCFCSYDLNEDEMNLEFTLCEDYDDKILRSIRDLERRSKHYESSRSCGPAGAGQDVPQPDSLTTNRLKLPEIPLPHFYRKSGESLERFLSNFEAILNKYSLTEYEKYIFLCKQVHNEALTLIKSLQGTNQVYSEAKKLLERAFASQVTQKYEIISDLSKLNLRPNGDCYKFIGDMSLIKQSFSNLKISCEDILNYFFWNAMPENLKLQLTHITNSSNPTLTQIEENIFEAINRFISSNAHNKSNIVDESAVTLAANVELCPKPSPRKYKLCVLCNDETSEHSINQCKKYNDPKSKVDRLNSLGFCTKCGFDNHKAGTCKFRFKKPCFNCNGGHFSFF